VARIRCGRFDAIHVASHSRSLFVSVLVESPERLCHQQFGHTANISCKVRNIARTVCESNGPSDLSKRSASTVRS